MKKLLSLTIVFLIAVVPLAAAESTGSVRGTVTEDLRNRAIPGVLVQLVGTDISTLTNPDGEFKLLNVPVGSYNVKFTAEGFKPLIKTDVIVRPDRITYLDTGLREQLLHLKESVEVTAGYFSKSEENPHSVFNISAEEVRRAPGTLGDISRVLTVMPGITHVGADENTDLTVRGGSPLENGFFVDNIEVPNINHLPRIGSTGGVISGLNQDLVQNIDFFTGGFAANYGFRLSSITDITLREGNRAEFDGQLDINAVQAGGVLEGPLPGGRGGWMVSARKSYFQLMKDAGILDVDAVPDTFDSQVKLTYDLSAKHKINLLNIRLSGSYEEDYGSGITHEVNRYTQNTLGVNWIANWSKTFISNTSLSYSYLDRKDTETSTYGDGSSWQWYADNSANYLALRNVNYLFFNNRNKLSFGFQVKYLWNDIDHFIGAYTNWMGDRVPDRLMTLDYKSVNSSVYLSYIWNPLKRLTATMGVRGDYWSAHDRYHASPRLSLSYELSSRLSVSMGFGIMYQELPMNLMAYWPMGKYLEHMKATHYTAGLEFFPGAGARITLEAYHKEYAHLPVDPLFPQGLVLDNSIDSYYIPYAITDNGSGYSRGVELMIHKKLIKKVHGILSATFSRSRYKDPAGQWFDRLFDNRYIINLGAGYLPGKRWEFSFKWMLVGGSPYTPFDMNARNGSRDFSRFMGARIPDYSTVNIRVEKRFYFGKSGLIVYLDIWNILNRENIYQYKWDSVSSSIGAEHQLTILPLFGIEYEF